MSPRLSIWGLLYVGPPLLLIALSMLLTHPLAQDWSRCRYARLSAGPYDSVMEQVFGRGRKALSRRLLVEADRFFHRGVHHQPSEPPRPNHFFADWAEAISPTTHQVLDDATVEEILPWLRLSIGADPSNAEAYAVAAYWLMRNGRPDQSLRVLRSGIIGNPVDYRLHQYLAEFYVKCGEFELAATEIQEARHLLPVRPDQFTPASEQDRRHLDRLEELIRSDPHGLSDGHLTYRPLTHRHPPGFCGSHCGAEGPHAVD